MQIKPQTGMIKVINRQKSEIDRPPFRALPSRKPLEISSLGVKHIRGRNSVALLYMGSQIMAFYSGVELVSSLVVIENRKPVGKTLACSSDLTLQCY